MAAPEALIPKEKCLNTATESVFEKCNQSIENLFVRTCELVANMMLPIAALLALVPAALSHGIITTPAPRAVGEAYTAACGKSLTNLVKQDNTSYVEALTKAAPVDSGYHADACSLYLCKGLQYTDNKANVQTWKAGDVVPIKIWLRIPHEGIANVSVVETKTNTRVSDYLKLWEKGYAPGKSEGDVPREQKEFSVTVPAGLEGTCATAGACVSPLSMYDFSPMIADVKSRCSSGGGLGQPRSKRTSLALTLRLRLLFRSVLSGLDGRVRRDT